MTSSVTGLISGLVILGLDFLTWRFSAALPAIARDITRTALFFALSVVLFRFDMSPFASAPWPDGSPLHMLAEGLELVWWLQGAQFVTVILDSVVLPAGWHRERLFQDVLNALIFIAAGIAGVAFVLELPVKGLLATSGAVAVVLGLALQSTLNDVFSGVVLNATQPFRMGDWVSVGGVDGKVVETNWRATTLINAHGSQVVIPNSAAAKANIVNHSQPPQIHGVTVAIDVASDVRPLTVLEALDNTLKSARDVLASPAPTVSVVSATLGVMRYEATCFVATAAKMIPARNALFDLAHRHLEASGIALRDVVSTDVASGARAGRDVADMNGATPHGTTRRARRLLENVSIFGSLDQDELDRLEARMIFTEHRAGDVLYRSEQADADAQAALHIVAKGVAGVYLEGASEQEVRRMVPGDYIGQSSILAGKHLQATVRALTTVGVYRLDKDALTPLIQARPDMARQMCEALSAHHADEQALLAAPPAEATGRHGMFDWLREGMKRFHQLDT